MHRSKMNGCKSLVVEALRRLQKRKDAGEPGLSKAAK